MLERIITALHLQELQGRALLDIGILALIIYQLLLLVRGTRAVQVIVGVVALVLFHFFTGPDLLDLKAVHTVLGDTLIYIPFVIVILFQNQIRQALTRFGRNPIAALFPRRPTDTVAEEVALAASALASKRLGALIIIERKMGLRAFSQTGIKLEAVVSYDLLMNLFTRGSPLHDGAVIIVEGKIQAASCYLPLTMNPTLSRTFGTRHRAAIGITEESDALAVVVSEERGVVSLAEDGKIEEDLDAHALSERLKLALDPKAADSKEAGDTHDAIHGAVETPDA
jgi:uncharacterized protein (TIGR00159 family)